MRLVVAPGMPNYLLEVHDEEFLRRSQLHIALDGLGRWAVTQHHSLDAVPAVYSKIFLVVKELAGIHVFLTRSPFGADILRR